MQTKQDQENSSATQNEIIQSLRSQLVTAHADISRLEDTIRAHKSDLREAENLADEYLLELKTVRRDLFRVRHSLSFQIGRTFLSSLSLRRILFLPFFLLRTVRAYKQNRARYQKREAALTEHIETQSIKTNKVSLLESRGWPPPMRSAILWQAQRLIETNSIADACDFVEQFGGSSTKYSRHLMECNRSIHDDQLWLEHLNAYIAQFNVTPITLLPGTEPRMYRLSATPSSLEVNGPQVSVIMPAFNAEATIRTAINSILNQTWKNLELIVIDDLSTDSTMEVVRELENQDHRIKIIRNSVNVGPYVSKNRGLKIASGQWITGHDADDWAHPERISRQVQVMRSDPSVKVNIAQMIRIDKTGRFSHFSKIGKTSSDGALRLASISCFFDAEFMRRKLGYWDSVRFGGDSEMIERARTILGEGFLTTQILSMICLDDKNSLTNHPVHGVSKISGISPTRRYYRDQWSAWHDKLSHDSAYLDFPQTHRAFDIPPEAEVSPDDVLEVIKTTDL